MNRTADEQKQIAETILEQLGGRRFKLMTGARHFSYSAIIHPTKDGNAIESENIALTFKLPMGRFNCVRIELTPADTYLVTFQQITYRKAVVFTTREEIRSDVYAEQLREVFREVTGLATEFPRVVGL